MQTFTEDITYYDKETSQGKGDRNGPPGQGPKSIPAASAPPFFFFFDFLA
jgi:hypothetical protein